MTISAVVQDIDTGSTLIDSGSMSKQSEHLFEDIDEIDPTCRDAIIDLLTSSQVLRHWITCVKQILVHVEALINLYIYIYIYIYIYMATNNFNFGYIKILLKRRNYCNFMNLTRLALSFSF